MGVTVTGIVILLVLLAFVIYGAKMGLIKSVVDLFAFFLTWLLTWFLYPVCARYAIDTPVYKIINNWIVMTLGKDEVLLESLPEYLYNLPGFIKDSVMASSKKAFDTLISSTADGMTVLTINIICFIILFVGIRLAFLLLKKMGRKINNMFVIGPLNVILGGAFGALQGVLAVYVAVMVISYFPASGLYNRVAKDIENSAYLGKMFNEEINLVGLKPNYPIIRGEKDVKVLQNN